MEAVELAVQARLLDEYSHNGYSIQVTTLSSRFQRLVKSCFLPVYRLVIMSIVCPMAVAGFTVVRFLRQHGQES